MKKMISLYLMVCLFVSLAIPSFAEPIQGAISELYSAEGYYEDSVGNRENYSYHVPQIASTSADADLQRFAWYFRAYLDNYKLLLIELALYNNIF